MDEAVRDPNHWSESRLEEGLAYENGYPDEKHLLEDDANLYSLHDELSAPY
jgi:hypothetical protein